MIALLGAFILPTQAVQAQDTPGCNAEGERCGVKIVHLTLPQADAAFFWNGVFLAEEEEGLTVLHQLMPILRATLNEGDVLWSLAGTRVTTEQELAAAFAAIEIGDSYDLAVLREGQLVEFELQRSAVREHVTTVSSRTNQ